MGPNLTPEARLLLQRQRWVIASWQAPGVGMNRRQLTWALRSGWQRVTPRTYLAQDGDVTAAQMRVAGVLDAGPGAALTGCSALLEAGWSGEDDGYVHVLVARGRRSRARVPPRWLRVHGTEEVPPRWAEPPRVSATRAAIDAASWASTRRRMAILTSVVQQHLVNVASLRRELDSRANVAGSQAMRHLLDDIAGGATSTAEVSFRRQCRARGLPTPRMQVRRSAGGRRRCTDAEFRLCDGRLVIVEIDGVAHMDVTHWHDDMERQNALAATTGAIVLRVTAWELREDPEPFFALLTSMLTGSV